MTIPTQRDLADALDRVENAGARGAPPAAVRTLLRLVSGGARASGVPEREERTTARAARRED